jgi:3'(2'), 5'-bisphosphate nucleotidase
VLGVLVCPALGRTFVGAEGLGAFEIDDAGARTPIRVAPHAELVGARVVVSRSHLAPETRARIEASGMVVVPCGSAGVKAAKIACGEADLYVQARSAGKLWDACAPEAVVRAAGGVWLDSNGRTYSYAREVLENVDGVAAGNPELVAKMVERFKARNAG